MKKKSNKKDYSIIPEWLEDLIFETISICEKSGKGGSEIYMDKIKLTKSTCNICLKETYEIKKEEGLRCVNCKNIKGELF